MSNEIVITVRGNVGANPVLNRPEGKEPWLRVNVASSRRTRREDGTWADAGTQWFAVKLFGDFARNVAESIRKGDPVVVQGTLERREWTTKDGERRWDSVIRPYAFGPDLRRATATVTRTSREPDPQDAEQAFDEDLVDISGMQEVPDDEEDGFTHDTSMAARISMSA